MASGPVRLTIDDHSRDSAGMAYVYPVLSRRAGGVSVGINLNPNNACNWRCIYCQVPDLRRGGPPPIDLELLSGELGALLDRIVWGDFLARHAPPGYRRVTDVAFSGNGEPTSAPEFADAVAIAETAMRQRGLLPDVKLRLITNGSLVDRVRVRRGISGIGVAGGEVWFKVDAVDSATIARINGVNLRPDGIERRLRECASLCETWIQTCLFSLDGEPPTEAHLARLLEFYGRCRSSLAGVHLYGLARPSQQTEASRLRQLAPAWLDAFAAKIRQQGLVVHVSP